MAAFGGMQITNRGRALQAKAQAGTQLQFTRLRVGSGNLSGQQIADLTDLIQPRMWLQLNKLQPRPGGRAVVGAAMTNQDVTAGFYFRELGVYAQDPDIGEILYCYGNAGSGAEYIPAGGGPDIVEKQIDIITNVGNASNVSAVIDESLIYATKKELDDAIGVVQEEIAKKTTIIVTDDPPPPDSRQPGAFYFHVTDSVSTPSPTNPDQIKVSPTMGIKIKE